MAPAGRVDPVQFLRREFPGMIGRFVQLVYLCTSFVSSEQVSTYVKTLGAYCTHAFRFPAVRNANIDNLVRISKFSKF